jgi:hypothetical protein
MTMRTLLLAAALSTAALAGPTSTAPEAISDVACLRKMALDLTHRGPTDDELARLKAKSTTLAQLADAYLASPEFSQVVFDWYRREFPPTSLTPVGTDTEEPARIARYVVMNDRDLRELLTGSYTVAGGGTVAQQTGKPAAGVLSTRHYMSSSLGLLRRNWAGRFQRQWTGIALQAVSIPPNTPLDTSREGLAANAICAGCHIHPLYGIDALAKFVDCWREDGSYDSACTPPPAEFLTVKGQGLPDLGKATVSSNEWKAQMVSYFFRQLYGRGLATSETGAYLEAVQVFEASGFKARALLRHFVTTPAYCAR